MRCYGIGHKHLEKCGHRPKKCVIYIGKYQTNEHQCGVAGYNKKRRKLWIYIVALCINYDKSYQANLAWYPVQPKAEVQTCDLKRINTN